MRTIIAIPEHQLEALDDLCKAEKISRAEAVRRALDAFLEGRESMTRDKAFGAWSQRNNGHAAARKLRAEWPR